MLLRTSNGGASWQQTRLPTTTNHLISFDAAPGGNLFAVAQPDSADNGVYESGDGGLSWHNVFTGTVSDVQFVTASNGYAVGQAGAYRTTDGGATWQPMLTDDAYAFVAFDSASDGYLASQGVARLLHTMDGGATWTAVSSPATDDCDYDASCYETMAFLTPT